MGSLIEIYLDRSNNEVMIAESLKRLTEKEEYKENFDLCSSYAPVSFLITNSALPFPGEEVNPAPVT